MLIMGIDDSGRGPLIGPMILAGVLVDSEQEKILKKHNVKDSKMLTHTQRLELGKIIEKNIIDKKIVKAYPKEIDEAVNSGTNLNTLEAMKTAEIINYFTKKNKNKKISIVIDCPSNNKRMWSNKMLAFLESKENLDIRCEHKADRDYVAVSAASILAKNMREEEVAKIKKEYGDIGSGYPADPVTKEFLKVNGKRLANSGIFRKSWATWKALFPEKNQSALKDFY